jgi:hypothetical protein
MLLYVNNVLRFNMIFGCIVCMKFLIRYDLKIYCDVAQ